MKKKVNFISKKQTNVSKGIKSIYVLGFILILAVFSISHLIISYHLDSENKQREKLFIEGSYQSTIKLLIKDLEVIFDEFQSLHNLTILTNYDEIKKVEKEPNVIGSVLYINRGGNNFIFDLSPLNSILVKILDNDFFYRISLNNQLLVTNSDNRAFSYNTNYKLNYNQILSLSFDIKKNSIFTITNQQIIKRQNTKLIVLYLVLFLASLVLVIYIIKQREKRDFIKQKTQKIELMHDKNLKYLSECNNLLGRDKLPIIVPNSNNVSNKINISELVEEIQIITKAYIAQYPYKYMLEIIAEEDEIILPVNSIVFRQIIISLVYNLLFFMRGGTHLKNFIIKITNEEITMQYDSFAAKEEHMCNWSNGIFEHLGNPYVLDCKKIFEQIKECKLNYQINPNQGKNKITINFENQNVHNKVIKFKKHV